MTVGELIEKLKEFDQSLEIGGSGHFGEFLELLDVYCCEKRYSHTENKDLPLPYISIYIQDAGEAPE